MKQKMKRLFAWGIILAMLLALMAGCGTSAGKEESTGAAVQETTAGSEEATQFNPGKNGAQVMQLGQAMPTGDMGKVAELNDMKEYTQEDVDRVNRAIKAYTPSVSEGLLINNSSKYYYYDSIPKEAQDFYDAMYMVAEDPVSADYYISVTLDKTLTAEEFNHNYYLAYQAMCFDHPELFWLYNCSKTSISAGSQDFQTFYFGIDESYTTFEDDMKTFNSAVDAFLADIDPNASEIDKARQVHDKLCQTVTYDMKVLELGEDPKAFTDLAHSAYGVLVANSRGDKNTAVCDGYSLAYQYLLTQLGMEAMVVPGKAGTDMSSLGGHAWNVVKIDGEWYEVDSTWDDNMMEIGDQINPDVEGYEYIQEALSDATYSEKLGHYLYGLTTPRIKDYTPGEDDYYYTKDGTHVLCLTGESKHYRASEFNDMGENGELAGYLPQATKSLY